MFQGAQKQPGHEAPLLLVCETPAPLRVSHLSLILVFTDQVPDLPSLA